MKNAKSLVPALAVILFVSLSCTFLKLHSGNSPFGSQDIGKLPFPTLDRNSPFPAMSSNAIDALVTEFPELAIHRDRILETERAAINGLLADVRAKAQARNAYTEDINPASIGNETKDQNNDRFIEKINLLPAAYVADDPPSMPDMGGLEYYIMGHQAGFFTPDYEKARAQDRGKSETKEIKNDFGTVLATHVVSVSSDGTVSLEFSTSINMPLQGLNANSKVKITGNQCPTSDGKMDLTIELSTNGRSGSSGSMIYDKVLKAKIMATVNDDAELASFDYDLKQSTRSTAGGRQVYVETSQPVRSVNGTYSDMDWGDMKIDRASSQATQADGRLASEGTVQAFSLAKGILDNAKERWQGGGCVKIDAESPGSVSVNSTNQIQVKVISKVDNAEVPSKLEAKLMGGAKVDPNVIPKTAGTLTYTAPGEQGKTATIALSSTSRRGRATLDLKADTGKRAYLVEGQTNGVSFKGYICTIVQPFTLDATFPGGKAKVEFNIDGSTSTDGGGGGCTMKGAGTYKLDIGDDTGTLKWTSTDTLTCPGFGNSRTKSFDLTVQPAPEHHCS
jgi:hypothetical protein